MPVTGITVSDSGLPGVTVAGGPIDLNPGQSDSTTFTASRSTISFEPAATTMMACPPAVATQAENYMAALSAANRA